MNKAYISLGSNEGDRLNYLREAVLKIQQQIGSLTELSSPYETTAWGFEGADFVNACIGILTTDPPIRLMEKLLAIERSLGRVRPTATGYSARTIDLDLLFYEDHRVDSERLTLPHPRISQRNFILIPLSEIAPDFVHPQNGMSIRALTAASPDSFIPIRLPLSRWTSKLFSEDELLVFEGNIGVGKTSLAQKIARDFEVPALLENFSHNPFLEKFYLQPKRFALPLENHFLEDRFRMFSRFLQSNASPKNGVSDHSLFKSLIFAKINLPPKDFSRFKTQYLRLAETLVFPQKIVFLHRPIEQLLDQIRKRGRSYEQKISSDYLKRIAEGYALFFEEEMPFSFIKIDLKDGDFLKDEAFYQRLLQQIKAV